MIRKTRNGKPIFRSGDKVVITIPKFVRAVGYPKTVKDYETEEDYSEIKRLINSIKIRDSKEISIVDNASKYPHVIYKIQREIAYLRAKEDGFGGRERMIHWLEYPEYVDRECVIMGVRTVCTGTYYPPSYSPPAWDEYYGEAEPGGLANIKQHRVATVNLYPPSDGFQIIKNYKYLEIPTYHLKHETQ